MEEEKRRVFGYWFLVGFLLMIPFSIYIAVPRLERAYDLSNNKQIAYGKVLDIYSCEKKGGQWHFSEFLDVHSKRGGIRFGAAAICNNKYVEGAVTYQYNVNQRVFKGRETVTMLRLYKVGDTVRITYSSKNPENSKLQ